jgi:hypothetical protein
VFLFASHPTTNSIMATAHHTSAPAGETPAEASTPLPNKDIDDMTPSSDRSIAEPHGTVQGDPKNIDEENVGVGGTGDAPPAHGAPDDEHAPRTKLQIALIMFSLAVAVLLVALDITIVTTALPTISEELKSAAGYTWIGTAYLIAQSAATPIWGKVSDIFGRKPILLLTNAIFFVGSLLAGVSVNMNMLIAARVIQGIGGGGLITLVNITISDLFSVRDRGAYFGMIGGVWALASSLGPIVGGLFTQKVSWRW